MSSDPWWIARFEAASRWLFLAAGGIAAIELVAAASLPAGDRLSYWSGLVLLTATVAARGVLKRPASLPWAKYLLGLLALLTLAAVAAHLMRAGDPQTGPSPAADVLSTIPPSLALVVCLVSAAALASTSRREALRLGAQGAAVAAGIIVAIVLVGVAYGDRDAGRFPLGSVEMTVASATAGLLLVGAMTTARPGEGLTQPMVSAGVGGVLLRRVLPVVILVPPVVIGLLVFRARFDAPGMLSVVAVMFMAVLVAGLLATARSLERFHGGQQIALEQANRATTALTQVAPVISDLDRALAHIEVERLGSLEVAARYSAASGMLAGESMAVFPIGEAKVGLVMVDAAGHGAQPALQALRLRDSLVQALRLGVGPAEAISSVAWLVDTPDDMATVAVMVADSTTGRVRVALGGHPPPLLDRGTEVKPLDPGGPLLHPGIDGPWRDDELEILPGHRLVFFTDGVADVFPRSTAVDGITEMASLLQRLGPASAEATADACLIFASKGEARRDDRAIVVLAMTD